MKELYTALLSAAAHAQATCDSELARKVQEAMIAAMIEVPGEYPSDLLRQHASELKIAGLTGLLGSGDCDGDCSI